jgi:GNAT superfamily N-acetyltransferase
VTAAPDRRLITVRAAAIGDVDAIRDVARTAWRATYRDLIGEEPVERFLAQAYAPERVALRIERHETWVATAEGGDSSGVDAFVEAVAEDGHAHIVAFYTRPAVRGQGIGSALLERVVAAFPGLDISADVLIGNSLGEPFYVARGFEPGDVLEEELGGETIRERRWWLRATVTGRE